MTDIQAEIDRIRQERAIKGGRMSNAEKARIAELEAMLINVELNEWEKEPMSEEGDQTEPVIPTSVNNVMAETLVDSLCIPVGERTRMIPSKGTMVEVPKWFAEKFAEKIKAI